MSEVVLNGIAIILFWLRFSIFIAAMILAAPSLLLVWLYTQLGGE